MEEEIKKLEEKYIILNSENTSNVCKEYVKSQYKEINKKMFDNFYTSKILEEFYEDYRNFLRNYNSSDKCKGDKKLQILTSFISQNENQRQTQLVNSLLYNVTL